MISVVPVISTADAKLRTGVGYVHWITISNTHATDAAAVELNDSINDGGTDRWGAVVEAIDFKLLPFHAVFDPPIRFGTGIWVDITGGTVSVVVGLR